jgi:dephospho-CoA kinase
MLSVGLTGNIGAGKTTVADLFRSWGATVMAEARRRGDHIVVSDIPLLFEATDPAEFDAVVLVDAPEALRQARLLASRNLSPEEIDRLMAVQLSSALKRAASTYIIDNDADIAALTQAAKAVWQALLARA